MTAPTTLPSAGPRASVSRLWHALSVHRRRLVAAVLLLVMAKAATLSVPVVIGRLVDHLRASPSGLVVGTLVGLVAVLGIVGGGLVTAGRVVLGTAIETVCAGLRDEMLNRALSMPLTTLEAVGTGDVLTRISDDTRGVGDTLRSALPQALEALLAVVVTAGLFLVLDYRLALAVVAAIPVHYLATRWYLRRSTPVYEALRSASAVHGERTLSIASALVMIKRFGLSTRYAVFDKAHSDHIKRVHHATVVLHTRYFGRVNAAEPIALLVVLAVGATLLGTGEITAGDFTAATLYVLALFGPFNQFFYQVGAAQAALSSLRRVVGLALLPIPAAHHDGGTCPVGGAVEFAGVDYSYPGRAHAVTGLDFHAEDGSMNVIVGSSGSGKSTLAKLLGGLLRPDDGEIRVAGTARSASWLAAEVAMVTQDTMAFTGTLRWNLLLSGATADDERLWTALTEFGAVEWARELPDGLDTVIGHTEVSLSVAQLQQVALARLSLSTARILVLDEPTAAMTGSEADRLDLAIRRLAANRTVFVVAHRMSLAPAADQVLVMADGRVIEMGTHAELLCATGVYRRLWDSWAVQDSVF